MSENETESTVGVLEPGEATQMLTEPETEATQMAVSVECPVCHTPNPPSETYCIDCGFLLGSEPVPAGEVTEAAPPARLVTPDGAREFALKSGSNNVGRENADVLLVDNTVSRKHAVITVDEGRVYVEDAGSTNGTSIDGARIAANEKTEAKTGSELAFGSAILRLEIAAPAEVEEEAAAEAVEEAGEAEPEVAAVEEAVEAAEPVVEEAAEEAVAEPEPEPVGRLVSKDGTTVFDVKPGLNRIGRRAGANDIVVGDLYCSGRHADLVAEEGGFTITDVGSTNGTFVNGMKMDPSTPCELAPGDEVTLGQVVFTLEAS